ncbi:hypothetical protein D3C81_1897900 [compost metagenome]
MYRANQPAHTTSISPSKAAASKLEAWMFCQRMSAESSSHRRSSSVSCPTSMPNHSEFAGVRPDMMPDDRMRAASVVVPSIILALRICASMAVICSVQKPLPRIG